MLRRQEFLERVWHAWLLFVKRQRLNRVRIQRLHMAIWRRHFLLRRSGRFTSQKVEHRALLEIYQTWRENYRQRSLLRRCIARMQRKALSRAWSAWVDVASDDDQPNTSELMENAMSPPRKQEPEHHHFDDAGSRRRLDCRCVRCFRRYGHLGAAAPSHHDASNSSFAVFESQCSLDEHLERRLHSARKLVASSATKSKPREQPATKPMPKSPNASTASHQQDDGIERLQKLLQAAHAIVQAHSHMR
jgi:hypothetical protein